MRIQIIGPRDAAWDEALARTPHDVYHTAAYVATEGRRIDAEPAAIVATCGEQQLFLPYLIRSCDQFAADSSEPVTDIISPYGYPGLLINEAGRNAEFASEAWSAVVTAWKNAGVCTAFLRMHPILSAGVEQLLPAAGLIKTGLTVAADLQLDEQALWMGLGHNHRRTLQRCRKDDFTARFVPFAEYLEPYRDVYNQTMDRVKAKDAYYFDEAYFRELSQQPGVHCCIVEVENHLAAACLFFESHGIVQAHLGGSANDYYRQSPFHLCLYHAMLWAKDRGNCWLHFGGGVGGDNDPLFAFKAGFSDARFMYHTARLILDEQRYRELVESASAAMNTMATDLLTSDFFPAYRSLRLEKV
jgi:hypothetical protein